MELKNIIRQSEIIPTDVLSEKITIIGAGAIGSFVALQLAKMGIADLTVYDADHVSDENMSNQFYRFKDIGKPKVEALKEIIKDFTDTDIEIVNARYVEGELSGIVISAVDSMEVRKLISENCNFKTKLLIDPRMGAESAMLFGARPTIDKEMDTYKKSLYSDADAVQERCTAKATIYTVNLLSGLVVKLVKDYLVEQKFFKRTTWDVKTMSIDCWDSDGKSPFTIPVKTYEPGTFGYERQQRVGDRWHVEPHNGLVMTIPDTHFGEVQPDAHVPQEQIAVRYGYEPITTGLQQMQQQVNQLTNTIVWNTGAQNDPREIQGLNAWRQYDEQGITREPSIIEQAEMQRQQDAMATRERARRRFMGISY